MTWQRNVLRGSPRPPFQLYLARRWRPRTPKHGDWRSYWFVLMGFQAAILVAILTVQTMLVALLGWDWAVYIETCALMLVISFPVWDWCLRRTGNDR